MSMTVKHQIRWFVKAGEELIPFESTMRGSWGFDAKCSCGWETHTGGAVRSEIRRQIADHKLAVKRPARECAACGGVCYWHDTDWVCERCGSEWCEEHNAVYAAPDDDE